MEYSRIQEEAQINEMILEKASEAAGDVLYTTEDAAEKGFRTIEGATVGGYKGIEHAVVGGYQKIENAFVSGWEKVEETCVDALFRKEGETTQEAMARLSANASAAEGRGWKGQGAEQ